MTRPYTDPEWDPASGGLPERRAWPSPTATGVTITMPEQPVDLPEPVTFESAARIVEAENALTAAVRNLLAAVDWVHRAQDELRKAREGR